MAARYAAGVSRSGINTANVAYFNLALPTATKRLYVVEIVFGIAVAPTTAPIPYLARTTARGTQSSTLAGLPLEPGDTTALGTLDVCGTGGSQPSFTAADKLGIGGLAVTAGGVWVWTFYDNPLVVAGTNGHGIAVCNQNASGSTTGTFVCGMKWDE